MRKRVKMVDMQMRDKMKNALAKFGGEWVDLPIFLPATTVLELAGESLRPRLYFATAPNGREICLRADLTIPSALEFIKNYDGSKEIITNLCSGKVFRANLQTDFDAHEFRQIGIEQYGAQSNPKNDIELFLAIDNALQSAKPQNYYYEFYDGNLLKLIISNADINPIWREYLLDAIQNLGLLRQRLNFAIENNKPAPSALAKNLIDLTEVEATKTINEILNIAKLKTFGIRDASFIAKRLQSKAKRAIINPLDVKFKNLLESLLIINSAPKIAINEIVNIAKQMGVKIENWAQDWHSRIEIIEDKSKILERTAFIAAKTGRFEYYDGFAFDILPNFSSDRALASGGRYDGLISELSKGKINISAIGGVIRPERILEGQNV